MVGFTLVNKSPPAKKVYFLTQQETCLIVIYINLHIFLLVKQILLWKLVSFYLFYIKENQAYVCSVHKLSKFRKKNYSGSCCIFLFDT